MNYTITHCHTDYSNGVTNIDSVTKYDQYIQKAKELGMKAIAITEHGSLFEWYKKKECCEKNGIKYIHGVEMYVTETLVEKKRDNYHCCLYAKNFQGFLELNKLVSKSFNREDGSYYYSPRITIEDLLNTSENIIMTSACLGGFFGGKANDDLKNTIINFMKNNKERCFLEIQHHLAKSQVELNKELHSISKSEDIRLIVGTDTHCLNDTHVKGRSLLQKSKSIFFENENEWDITLKTYDELINMFKKQNAIPMEEVLSAIENTNVLADMVEEFKIDKSYKYPTLWEDSIELLKDKVRKGIIKRGVNKYSNYKSEYIPRINYELEVYIHNGAIDFLLLDEDIKSEMRERGIECGYSRGSCSGSVICYLIGMTEIDSIKHNLSFERFMSKNRISLADVDTDWQPNHRDIVKEYIYNKNGLYCADIITFNTIALKGSIRDVCKGLYSNNFDMIPKELKKRYDLECEGYGKPLDDTSKKVNEILNGKYLEISNYICSNVDQNEDKMRKEYPEVFEYVDIINGTIVSIGTHPCGLICSPQTLNDNMGLCTISKCDNPVSMISMKSIDAQNYVKLDILGLANIQVINETCKLANIKRLTPNNVDENDLKVWESIRDDNLLIFQWESNSAGSFLKTLLSNNTLKKIGEKNPNFRYMDLLSMGNGAIRPAGASYRQALSEGIFRDNGHYALNDLLSPTMGYLVYQEQILEFLHVFCGFTKGEADIVRRGFAKKTGTEQFIPQIKSGFIKTMKDNYNVDDKEAEILIENFLIVIQDASEYLFSLNHSEPYSYIGYICGYLRYYYPLEFLTVALNINNDDLDKTKEVIEYAEKRGVNVKPPKYGYSKGDYFFDTNTKSIYKGVSSIKNLNETVANELYELSQNKEYNNFLELLKDIKNTSCNSRQLDILIKIDYFDKFGKSQKLLDIAKYFNLLAKDKEVWSPKKTTIAKTISDENILKILSYNSDETETTYKNLNWYKAIEEIYKSIPNKDMVLQEKLQFQNDILGYIDYRNNNLEKKYVVITGIDTKFTPTVDTYCLNNGKTCKFKIPKKVWNEVGNVEKGQFIYLNKIKKEFGWKSTGKEIELKNGKTKPEFVQDENKLEWKIYDYTKVNIDEVLNER